MKCALVPVIQARMRNLLFSFDGADLDDSVLPQLNKIAEDT